MMLLKVGGGMLALYLIVLLAVVGLAVFYVVKEYIKKPSGEKKTDSRGVVKNKKQIEAMVANVESIIVYANGNDVLCRRLVEAKDTIRFFNPTTKERALMTDNKIASKLDDLKIAVAKDNTQETCMRLLEEVEALIVQRKKDEIG